MRVLEPGRTQAGWATEAKCTGRGNGGGGCGAKLLVEAGDLYKTHRFDHGGGHDVFTTFMCSACGVETDLDGCPVWPTVDKREWLAARAQHKEERKT